MKKITKIFSAALLLVWTCSAFAQAPQKFSYQAVVRDGSGNVIANHAVGVRLSIHESTANGTVVYQETQTQTTNQFGLITLQVGAGTQSGAVFTSVDWSKKAKYIQMEIDAEGGTNYTDIGSSELISVPYALYAENTGGSVSSKDSVPAGAFGQTLRYDTVGVDRWVANSLLYNNGTRLGIGTASPLCRLHVADGAVLFTGTSGATPVSGAGTRFMWIPPKKALRAGTVSGNQWDDANLGLSSVSVGEDNIASGTYSVAFGRQDSATGSNSTAIGFRNLASNTGAVAFGGNNKATGYYSFTAGNMNRPSGQYSATLGYSNMASADYSVAMGKTNVAGGQYSLALGYLTQATGNYSFAQGKSTIASGVYSMASGEGSVAGKNNCVSFGYYNTANGMYSVAMGIYTYARSYASTVFGKHNVISGDSTAWIATDPIFVIGNGTSSASRSNALTVLKNGNTGIGTAIPEAALDVASTTNGVLMPRMTTIQRNAIVSPAQSLMIFNLTTNCFEWNNYGAWISFSCGSCPAPAAPATGTHTPLQTEITWDWNMVTDATGYKWNTTDDFGTATDAGANTSCNQTGLTCGTTYTLYVWAYNVCGSNSSATTLTQSTSCCPVSAPTAGTHNPFETEIEWMWNVVSGADGYKWNTSNDYGTATDTGNNTMYFQSGLTCNTPYTLYVWAYNSCGNYSSATTLTQSSSCCPVSAPTAGTHISGQTQIEWNWNAVSGATGYKWNTADDYGTAIDNSTSTDYTKTSLTCGTEYSLYVWAYNSCGSYSSTATLFRSTSACPFICGSILTDTRDSKTYTTVQIGSQCWMKQNLNYGSMIIWSEQQTDNLTAEKYCYNNNEANCTTFGGLYQWAETVEYLNGTTNSALYNPAPAGNVQGICPAGWHVPSNDEWTTLERAICTSGDCATDFPYDNTTMGWRGTDEGGKLKETGTTHWNTPNTGATNSSGFTALPGGYRDPSGFANIGELGVWRSSDEFNPDMTLNRYLNSSYSNIYRYYFAKEYGYSVRCLND